MVKDLIIIGAGGLGREVAWLVERINKQQPTWRLLGFIDDSPLLAGKTIGHYPMLGESDSVAKYPDAYFVCAVGSAKVRRSVIQKTATDRFATLIDPSVLHSDSVKLGEGVIICAGSILTVDISIGDHVIINPGCTLGHDAVLHDFVTLYPGVNVSGATDLGMGCEMGTGSQIIQGKSIGAGSIIGAGGVVIRDIPMNCTAVGCPAKPIKYH